MSIDACAELVERADRDRFLSVMALRPEQRDPLFVLYAFNIEVSRAPWVTQEPMIAEMRLQWWRDVIEEIAEGHEVRRHEVATPLAEMVKRYTLDTSRLDRMVIARRHDIYRDPFENLSELWSYLDDATGGLMIVAGQVFGLSREEDETLTGLHAFARADAVARYIGALGKLEEGGRSALPLGVETEAALAKEGLTALAMARNLGIEKPLRPATWAGWWVEDFLARCVKGKPAASQFKRKLSLLLKSSFKTF
jgi:phytoene/squalene synthetase